MIVDALDEYERPDIPGPPSDSPLLSSLRTVRRVRFRILVTSRPEVVHAFKSLQETKAVRTLSLLDQEFLEETRIDIECFLKAQFEDTRLKRQFRQNHWPDPEVFGRLVQLSTNPELMRLLCVGLSAMNGPESVQRHS